LGIHQGIPMS